MYWKDKLTGLSITEQLYSARGSQGVGTSHKAANQVGADPTKSNDFLILENHGFSENGSLIDYYSERVLWTDVGQPNWAVGLYNTLYMSIPQYVYIA